MTYTSGRRPKAANERTRGGWGAENAAHSDMGIWLMRKVRVRECRVLRGGGQLIAAETNKMNSCRPEKHA